MDANISKEENTMRYLVCMFFISFSVLSNAVTPTVVTNPSQESAETERWAEMLARWEIQLDHMKSKTGNRGMANGVKTEYLIKVNKDIAKILKLFEVQERANKEKSEQQTAEEMHAQSSSESAAYYSEVDQILNSVNRRFKKLKPLMSKINDTDDQKSILELQARILSESTLLQNELIKVSLLRQQEDARKEMRKRKKEQLLLESTGTLMRFE